MNAPAESSNARWAPLAERLFRPLDSAALAVFRVLFGAMMAYSLVRFAAQGWIELVLVKPTFFFKYDVFPWTVVWDRPWLYLHFAVTAVAALFVAAGLWYRAAIVVFFLGFTYLQLLDVTLYLNHYYLVVLLSGLMVFVPLNAGWSHRCMASGPHKRNSPCLDHVPAEIPDCGRLLLRCVGEGTT